MDRNISIRAENLDTFSQCVLLCYLDRVEGVEWMPDRGRMIMMVDSVTDLASGELAPFLQDDLRYVVQRLPDV